MKLWSQDVISWDKLGKLSHKNDLTLSYVKTIIETELYGICAA